MPVSFYMDVHVPQPITASFGARGELIGVEILGASRFVRDTVLESAQGRSIKWRPVRVQDLPQLGPSPGAQEARLPLPEGEGILRILYRGVSGGKVMFVEASK